MPYTQPSITPEMLTPRLGEYLVLEKRITQQQLNEALQIQKKFRQNNPGKHGPLVGEILVERGYVEKAIIDRSVTEMIMRLKNALERSNSSLEKRVKERTQELEIALQKIQLLNEHKSEFVANISHELRTPLTHIIGYTDLLLDGTFGELEAQQLAAVESILNATDRLETLIMDLISFTDIEQGTLRLSQDLIAPEDICRLSVNTLQESAQQKNIRLLEQYEPNIPKVQVDADRLQWVIRQFISNAIKFSPESGYVLVKTKRENEYVKFSVIDTGIGIPKDKIPEIFEPFIQLDGSSTRNAGGTGIGLTICKAIIEAHKSKIMVRSEVAKGSEFSFLIPIPEESKTK